MEIVAAECFRGPNSRAVWSPERQAYVCPDDFDVPAIRLDLTSTAHPPINPMFKLVFVTAAGGTLFFAVLCVALAAFGLKASPTLIDNVFEVSLNLLKIGFGAIIGMLGGIRLQGERAK